MEQFEFEIETRATYSLNYMVFMQNIFLNLDIEDRLRFPYLDSSKWGLLKGASFVKQFEKLWDDLVHLNNTNNLYDHNAILEFDRERYQALFENNEVGSFGFTESRKAFTAWFDGIYGKIAVQNILDEVTVAKIYQEMSQKVVQQRRLIIDVVYDLPVLCKNFSFPWYVVLPIEYFYLKNKRDEVISVLAESCKS